MIPSKIIEILISKFDSHNLFDIFLFIVTSFLVKLLIQELDCIASTYDTAEIAIMAIPTTLVLIMTIYLFIECFSIKYQRIYTYCIYTINLFIIILFLSFHYFYETLFTLIFLQYIIIGLAFILFLIKKL